MRMEAEKKRYHHWPRRTNQVNKYLQTLSPPMNYVYNELPTIVHNFNLHYPLR